MFLTLAFGYATYFVLTTSENPLNSRILFALLYIDTLLLFFIGFIITIQIKRALKFNYKKEQGNQFHKQVITLFSCVTIIPAACVFIFGVIFFNVGIETLFRAPVKGAIDAANQVASIYITNNIETSVKRFASGVSNRIKGCISGVSVNSKNMEKILNEDTDSLNIDAIVVRYNETNTENVIARSQFALSLLSEKIPQDPMSLNDGDIISWESDSSIISLEMISRDLGIYLMASSEIDQRILDLKHKTQEAVAEYTNLETQRYGLKIKFMAFFTVITILLLMASILVGFTFANWILRPINKLIIAAKNVSSGNYNTPIKTGKFKNEWDILISSFNIMISKLEQQKQQLIISNTQNAWRDIARKIAHEIKNPLTPIQLAAERLKRKYQKDVTSSPEIFNNCIDTIIRQVNCIGSLVTEFSDFARMPAPKIEKVDIIKLINDTVFIQASAHKHISFHKHFDREEFICPIDPTQMNQVMMNILQNAINSIAENKKTRDNDLIGNISVSFSVKMKSFCITIEDDGPGFSTETIEKALEPYYTTREAGNGLGLAIVYKIVTEHAGVIKLGASSLLGGASIVIEIPYV